MKTLFKIETKDGTGTFIFFTETSNHKLALKKLIKNSNDFKNIVNDNRDLTITIKSIRP